MINPKSMKEDSSINRSNPIFIITNRPTPHSRKPARTVRHSSNTMQTRPSFPQPHRNHPFTRSHRPSYSIRLKCSGDSFQCSTLLPASTSPPSSVAKNGPIQRLTERGTTPATGSDHSCLFSPRTTRRKTHTGRRCSSPSTGTRLNITRCAAMNSRHQTRWRSRSNTTTTVFRLRPRSAPLRAREST